MKETVEWVKNNPKPELGFFDIRLADGDSFEIFEKIKIDFPVIFTTAYDEYALKDPRPILKISTGQTGNL